MTATTQVGPELSLVASADLSASQFRWVKAHTVANQVAAIGLVTEAPLGVLTNEPDASGKAASIQVQGIAKVEAAAAITIGDRIGPSANGRAEAKTEGTDTTEYVAGIALETAGAAGEIISVRLVDPHRAA